jgi:DNA-binding HxlR family transcriptional regulator
MSNQDKPYSDPVDYFLSVVGGRWKLIIIYLLSREEVMRYSQLKRRLKGISDKMLSTQLKELERDNIIIRKQYEQIPPKVEYQLSEKGSSLLPIISSMYKWGKENINTEWVGLFNHSNNQDKGSS